MKIVAIADTHNKHNLILPEHLSGDMIIHAGDISSTGSKLGVEAFLYWFDSLPFKYKIFIAGNHDWYFDITPKKVIKKLLKLYPNIIYLNDSGVTIEGFKIWGSPIQPWFYNWAFNRFGESIQPHWDKIPANTEILITHGPARGYGDMTTDGDFAGCPRLFSKIVSLQHLKLHICGHIHEGYGRRMLYNQTEMINASVLDEQYVMVNNPVEIIITK
jgi:Icc-related predicted phosphoesterase